MGTYYILANEKKKQFIEPFNIGDGGIKSGTVIFLGPTFLSWPCL